MRILILIIGLTLLVGCAHKQPSYANNYSNSYSNNSIPAVQYDSSYRNGCNKAVYSNSYETYSGGYCYGKKKGAGVATYQNPPSRYDGMFDNDMRNGYGIYTWTNTGDTYAGYWKDGLRDGFGTYTWNKDGSYESGSWVKSRQELEHKLYYKGGVLYASRVYKNGVLMGTSVAQNSQASSQKSYSDPSVKVQKCKRLGLVEGSEDYQLCLKSIKN